MSLPGFVFPVPAWNGRTPTITSGFRTGDRPTHVGVDVMYPRLPEDGGAPGKYTLPSLAPRFFMPPGIPALAIGEGTVKSSLSTSTGEYVAIDHGGGLESQYMHLRNRRVAKGDKVAAGQIIGDVSYNPADFKLIHLHFQLRRNGSVIDPAPVIASLPVAEVVTSGAGPSRGLAVLGVVALVALGLVIARREWA